MSGERKTGPGCVLLGVLLASILLPQPARAQVLDAVSGDLAGPRPAFGEGGLLGTFSLTSRRGPVTISAKELEFEYKTRRLTYRGGVSVKQGDMTLHANVLRVTLGEDTKEGLKKVVAEGEVRMAQGDRIASGGRAVFDQDGQTVVLSEQVVLRQGPNEVAGERVIVYLNEERSIVEGGESPVTATLFPGTTEVEGAGSAVEIDRGP